MGFRPHRCRNVGATAHKKGAALLRRGATRRRRRDGRLSGNRRRLCNLDNESVRDRYRLLAAYEKRANKKTHRMTPGTSELNGSEVSLIIPLLRRGSRTLRREDQGATLNRMGVVTTLRFSQRPASCGTRPTPTGAGWLIVMVVGVTLVVTPCSYLPALRF